jgi:hypothetical protein
VILLDLGRVSSARWKCNLSYILLIGTIGPELAGRQSDEFSGHRDCNDGSKASRRDRADLIRINAGQMSAMTLVAYRCGLA